MKFTEMNLSEEVIRGLADLKYDLATEIQAKTIPAIIAGSDIIGKAQTGTGKTAAFGVPLIELCNKQNKGIEHLILTPTRELASQVAKEILEIGKYKKIRCGVIVGGASYTLDRKIIKSNPHIIVATPGRLLDHLKNQEINLSSLKCFTLDEADEMLDIGFSDELNLIIDYLPNNRQSLLFSATISPAIKKIASKLLVNPQEIFTSEGLAPIDTITQLALIVEEHEKLDALEKILAYYDPESVMIFGRTKRRADELAKALTAHGHEAVALHGDLSLRERTTVMEGFKGNKFPVLVATDVAARGIHVDNVGCVINFDLPQEIEYYVHRIGRTGRAGRKGMAISFIRHSELPHLRLVEKTTNSKIQLIDLPDPKMIKKAKEKQIISLVEKALQDAESYKYYQVAKKIIETYGAEVSLACIIGMLVPQASKQNIELTGEPPVRVKKTFVRTDRKKRDFSKRRRYK